MSIFSWFNKIFNSHVDSKATYVANLELKDILDSHRIWKDRLLKFLESNDFEDIDINTVKSDTLCTQGQWLYGPGKLYYSDMLEYKRALKSHSEFHECATKVVIEYQKGHKEVALDLLNTRYRHVSNKNQQNLTALLSAVNSKSV